MAFPVFPKLPQSPQSLSNVPKALKQKPPMSPNISPNLPNVPPNNLNLLQCPPHCPFSPPMHSMSPVLPRPPVPLKVPCLPQSPLNSLSCTPNVPLYPPTHPTYFLSLLKVPPDAYPGLGGPSFSVPPSWPALTLCAPLSPVFQIPPQAFLDQQRPDSQILQITS